MVFHGLLSYHFAPSKGGLMPMATRKTTRTELAAAEKIMENLVRTPPQPHKEVSPKNRVASKPKPANRPRQKVQD